MAPKRLVIDASIARASGGADATHPEAVASRDFLLATLNLSHEAVFTLSLQEEWNKHQSTFARKWRGSMVAKRRFVALSQGERKDLRQAVEDADMHKNEKSAMLKDCHLVEAALATDGNVISLDDKAGALFSSASSNIHELHKILWVNPSRYSSESISWLEGGASNDGVGLRQWRLGNN